jgi:ACS family allantoate permease-like MFS transporter
MLVGLPAGLLNFITSWISALVPWMFPNTRIYTALCLILIPLAGSIMLFVFSSQTDETYSWGIAVSTWLATCYTAPLCSCAGLLASNVKGNTKTSVVGAGFFVAYSIGSIIAPLIWGSESDTRYLAGCTFSIVNWSLLIITLVAYLLIVKKENQTRDCQAANRRLNSEVGGPGGRDDDLSDVSED